MAQHSYNAPWHKQSYDRFINERLPELIASRLPLEAYSVSATGPYECKISLTVTNISGASRVEIENIPRPDETGLFEIEGSKIVVTPTASCEELDEANIQCVGEQLYDFVEPRLGGVAPDLPWDKAMVRSWLPINTWVREFLRPDEQLQVTFLDDRNWLSRCEHLRRIMIDVPQGHQRIVVKEQLRRACPIVTPEGPNMGRILSVARGAEIRGEKMVPGDDTPQAKLSVNASVIPLIEHDDSNRALMGANMMRQWLVLADPEPALVQTGNEPDVPEFWCGRDLLTAFISWGQGTFEDGVVISESCAKRLCFDGLIEPGDKVSNRHGSKGVVSQILPDDEMPHLNDGTPVELVFSFIGLHTRLNFGQLREALIGRIARAEGKPFISPPFSGPTEEEIRRRLAEASLPENGMEILRMGKNGPALKRPSTTGWVYWGLTHHLVRDKLHVTPDVSKKRQEDYASGFSRGQRRGEAEYWTLRDIGAFENIIESFNTCSCEREGATDLAKQLAREEVEPTPPPTPMFTQLKRRLAAGGVDMLYDGKKVSFALVQPPGERLTLACPVPHPWLRSHELTEVGVVPEMAEYQQLADANTQLCRLLAGKVPEKLIARSRNNLERIVRQFFEELLSPEGSQYKGAIVAGGRVSFSGRTVIAPAIDLRTDQVGLPNEMAWGLFGPSVAREIDREQDVLDRTKLAAEKLDIIMARSWVIVNRAPTVTDTGHIAFHPVRIPERAIRLHPLACRFMNADFDGDQVAVFLPVTPAAQKEAADKLSIAAHLARDPRLVKMLCPTSEALWGLADMSLRAKGRGEIEAIVGVDLTSSDGFISADSTSRAVREVLDHKGEEKTLEILEELARHGFDAAKRSGASVSPFAGESLDPPLPPPALEFETCQAHIADMEDAILSRTDYEAADLGPQLLSVKCGARGKLSNICSMASGAIIADIGMVPVFVPHGFAAGLEAHEWFQWAHRAQRKQGQLFKHYARIKRELREDRSPRGFSVLARAMRSRCAGLVLARAAAIREVDPLTDPDARLFVGLRP